MTTHKLLLLLFVYLISSNIHSQTKEEYCEQWEKQVDTISNLDSELKFNQKMLSKVDPICKVNILIASGSIYRERRKIDSAMYFYDEAIKLSNNIKDNELLALGYASKAYLLIENKIKKEESLTLIEKSRKLLMDFPDSENWRIYYDGRAVLAGNTSDYKNAVKYFDSTIIMAKRFKDTVGLSSSYQNKAVYLMYLSKYEKSIENFLLSIELKENVIQNASVAPTYYNLGFCYTRWGKFDLAKKYITKSIEHAKKENNEFLVMLAYIALTSCNRELKELEEASQTIDSALVYSNKNKAVNQKARILKEKAWLYHENFFDYDKAESYFKEAYEIAKTSNDYSLRYSCLQGLIDVNVRLNRFKNAKKYLEPFRESAEKLNEAAIIQNMHRVYSEYYEQAGELGLAMKHYRRYYAIKDSISNDKVKSKIADLEAKYDTKNKELEIVSLSKEKEQQQQIAKEAKAQQNLYLLAAGFLLFLLVAGAWAFGKLRKQQKELTSTNQVKNRLFSIIAHDLRGMILPFQRSGKILKHHIDKENYEKTIELSQALEKNSESLSNMLDNLLNWSLEQMDGYKMNPETISVGVQLAEIVSGYEQQASYKKTKIDLKLEKDLNITFDKGAFDVIFRNLIGNALKYTEEGNIRIEFTREKDQFLCSVTDTGIGMSADQLQNVFTLEEKKSTIGTQGEKGTGLGLNLVYRFIKMHKGTINVSSEKRIGTRFDLSFPAVKQVLDKKEERKPISA